nr:phosphatidylinositol 3-kinase 2-like isoform X1 [Aedes albopictus]XP_029729295.1 phosphatidylinositol 3-kinase 2-like isoform X1 [Aedes albopictus]XP_029729296.1 phosphatidylinositol 3-kinase 2-like isoform X1 [Aedes albopictus]
MDVDSPNSLKRCSSAPQINNLLPSAAVGVNHPIVVPMDEGQSQQDSTVAGSTQQPSSSSLRQINPINSNGNNSNNNNNNTLFLQHQHQSPNHLLQSMSSSSASNLHTSGSIVHRDPPPTSFSNIFTRTRRFSASFSPLAVMSNGGSSSPSRSGSCTPGGPRLTPRISQLRQEECADLSNSREVNHEREVHSAMQMSQSYEDLTLVTENWSFSSGAKNNDDLGNPLHVALPSIGTSYCSSPSPTSRGGLGLQYPTTSPSPTRKFVTRRSMSPCPIRPSPLSSSVKRKFDLDDNYGSCCSPPPLKKIFTSERGSSPSCQTPSPSPICASPDSSTASFENGSNNASSSGRITPKFFVTKLGSGQLSLPNSSGTPNNTGGTPQGGSVAGLSTASGGTIPLHTDSPPSSSSSSSLMMMDCGVSSSSGHNNQVKRLPLDATVSSSAGETSKIDCDEDITDLNAVASSSSMATSIESSEAMMEEVLKTTRALESERTESSELLLDSSSSVSNSHRLSTGSIGSAASNTDINSESNSSLCPLGGFGSGVSGATNGTGSYLASNIEIAET